MKALLFEIRTLRQMLEAADATLAVAKAEMESKQEVQDALTIKKTISPALTAKVAELKKQALELYHQQGAQALHPALKVRKSSQIQVTDPGALLTWAQANMPVAIQQTVDTKMLTPLVGSVDIPGITVQDVEITLASKLEEYELQ